MTLLVVTAFVIAALFAYSMYVLFARGKILAIPTIMQAVLFCALYYQLYTVLGHQHYQYGVTPRWYHWTQFTAAHILRAGDIFDVLDEYSISMQNVQHNSNLVVGSIIAMHWITDIFLIALIVQLFAKRLKSWWETVTKGFWKTRVQLGKIGFWTIVVVLLLAYSATAAVERWRFLDILLLWPLDNLARVLDVGDSLQLFQVKFHHVADSRWHSTLAVVFRLVSSAWIAYYVNKLRMIVFRGKGVTLEDLMDNLRHEDAKVRKAAAGALGSMGKNGRAALHLLLVALKDKDGDVRSSAREALGQIEPNWQQNGCAKSALPILIQALKDRDSGIRRAAAEALGVVHRHAHAAIPTLLQAAEDRVPEVRQAAKQAIQQIDPEWYNINQTFTALSSFSDILGKRKP